MNSVNVSRQRDSSCICSGSDDGSIRIWDTRSRSVAEVFQDRFQLLAVTYNGDGTEIISSGIENVIKRWDVRKGEVISTMPGHTDSVTGLRLTQDGKFV